MSPRRLRVEARVFRGESVAFEACAGFRPGAEPAVCRCGWLEDDHHSRARVPAAGFLAVRRSFGRASPVLSSPRPS